MSEALAPFVNIEIMRALVRLRQMLQGNAELAQKLAELEEKYDAQFGVVFDAIPSAPFDNLDLDRPVDEEEWKRRVVAMAAARIAAERARLERMGIIDENGDLRSNTLPLDMLPDSDTTL